MLSGLFVILLRAVGVRLLQSGLYSVVVASASAAAISPPAVVAETTEAALRAAMAGGGVVSFAGDGTITLASEIVVSNDTVLDGTGRHVTISGNEAVRVFCVNTNTHFTVLNLTITDGASSGGSAILNLGGAVDLDGVAFQGNTATPSATNGTPDPLMPAGGGAILNRGGTVTANDCSFTANQAKTPPWNSPSSTQPLLFGGAIRNESGQVDVRSSSFLANGAYGGSPVSISAYPGNGEPGSGGAIHNSGTATLDLCTFTSNSANGGSSWGDPAGLPGAEGSGGAIFNEGTLTVNRTTLYGNTATGGSGGQGWATLDQENLDGYPGGDGGAGMGGAICNLGSLWIAASTFASNVVSGGGAGAGGGGRQFMDVGGNGAAGGGGGSGLGGALHNGGTVSLVNCTLAFNWGSGGSGANGGGGAMSVMGSQGGAGGGGGWAVGGVDGPCSLTNCTLAGNMGYGGSGGAGGFGFVWQGKGGDGAPGVAGTAWGGASGGMMVNTLTFSNSPAGVDSFPDPKLGPLADNGGPTLTMALLPGSSAIDAGDTASAPPTDQRGFPRPFGPAADIGAYEAMPLYSVVANASAAGAGSVSGGGIEGSGTTVTLLASTNSGFQFVAWTENGEVVSVSPSYCFAVNADRTLAAVFAPYPFIPPKGAYACLFADLTSGVSPQSSGCLTLSIAAKGAYSASLQLAGIKYPLSGQFDGGGKAEKVIPRRGLPSLAVVLELDLLAGAARVAGTISAGRWTAGLVGNRACFDAKTNVAPQQGRYTMILPGAHGSTNEPAGDSYASLVVSPAGVVSSQVALADGTRITLSAPVSTLSQWPLYASLYGGQGVLWGWLSFTNVSDLAGSPTWTKPASKSTYYPAGFSVAAPVRGARYLPPGRGTNVLGLAFTTNLTLTLEGGSLTQVITNRLALSAGGLVTIPGGSGLSLAFTPSTGVFNGKVVTPKTSAPVPFGGVVLQGQEAGFGFFRTAGQSGQARLDPSPAGQ